MYVIVGQAKRLGVHVRSISVGKRHAL